MQRASGILLHPTALPGPCRIGDLGEEAYRFVDFLVKSGQSFWQILPLGPTGYGHSPYNALSAFAGNPALIDLAQLAACGDLDAARLDQEIGACAGLDFDRTHSRRSILLQEAGRNFFCRPTSARHQLFEEFCHRQAYWLDDFCQFMSLRDNFAGRSWAEWPNDLRTRQPGALQEHRRKFDESWRLYQYQQFVFDQQWHALKAYANSNGLRIFGDIPIFVAYDSADVWANQRLFQLDDLGRATAVAGVPPDYFSKTGQRWGNPLYRWDHHVAEGFQWWLQRFQHQLKSSDLLRIDHFRGFQACWSIPAKEKTAVSGQWEEVPGRELFAKLHEQMTELPIVAEDLGMITPQVERLRDEFAFPGMKILQFAFDSGPDNPYLPENFGANCVVYTGTHDNDTTLGWWQGLSRGQKDRVNSYLGNPHPEMPWELIRLAMASIADLCIIPCQDILGLGKEARFNTPGHATGNWQWQLAEGALNDDLADRLHRLTETHHRTTLH